MVTEAGEDTRWSGSTQIIYPGSSLFQILVRAGTGMGEVHPETRPLAPVMCAWWETIVVGHCVCLCIGGGTGVGHIAVCVL